MPFRSIVGHRHVVQLLTRAVARDCLPPSLILSGPEGVGKHRVAVALAQAVNCTSQPSEGGCGKCAACRRIERGIHPDVRLVEVGADSAIIKVDQIREVIEVAQYRPYEGRRRVVIIDPADAMERYAQNALLKILEETPPATIFVLVTSRPDVLLPTVRSRCPQLRFGALDVGEIAQVLMRERRIGEREARAAAIVASGSVARAMEAASEETTEARSQALALLRQAASTRDSRELLEGMKGVLGLEKKQEPAVERENVLLSLRALSSLLRDVTMIEARGGQSDLANADLRPDLEAVAASFGRDRIMRAFAAVDRALGAIGSKVNPKLVVDWLAFNV